MVGIGIRGEIHLATFDEIGRLTNAAWARNIVCKPGLNDLAQSMAWAAAQDQGSAIGANSAFLTPVYGAVGTATNPPGTDSGNTTNGSYSITGTSNPSWVTTGMVITGTGIPAGTLITAINTGPNSYTISNEANATNTGVTLTIGTSETDSALYSELTRAQLSGVGSAPDSGSGALTQMQFQFPVAPQNYTLTEAGVFVLAGNTAGSGDLLNHALYSGSGFSWVSGDSMTMTVNFYWFFEA